MNDLDLCHILETVRKRGMVPKYHQ